MKETWQEFRVSGQNRHDRSAGRLLTRSSVPTRRIRCLGTDHAFLDRIGLYPQAEDRVEEIAAEARRL